MNLKKTKILRTAVGVKIKINDEEIQEVDKFNFLVSIITREVYSKEEIKKRIALSKCAIQKLNKILDTGILTKTKIKVIKTAVFLVVLYGNESWTLEKRG